MDEHQIAADTGWIEIGNRAGDIELGVLDNAPIRPAQGEDKKRDQGNWRKVFRP
jgi:hypothetical protein